MRALQREWPLLVGLLLGASMLWWRGAAFVPTSHPVGPDWHQYFMAAWKLSTRAAEDYPAFRLPLYPAVLGLLGARTGYAPAAVFLSSTAGLGLVLCAGLLARAAGGRWAGGLAALAVPAVGTTAAACRWAAQYPFLGALTGLALAAGAAGTRWPRWPWALLCGLAAGLCWATDGRGLAVLLAAVGLTALSLRRAPRAGWSAAAFLAGASAGPAIQRALEVVPRPQAAWLLQFQRGQAVGDIQRLGLPGLAQVCTEDFLTSAGLSDALGHPCGRALLAHNLGGLGAELPFGLSLTALGLLLVLLPGRAGWRGTLASLLAFWLPAAALGWAATFALLPGRYVLMFAVPLAAALPVGLARLGQHLPRGRAVGLAALALAAVVPLRGALGPRGLPPPGPIEVVQARLIREVRARVAPGDLLLDCSHNLKVEVALLPHVHHPEPARFGESPDPARCTRWAGQPDDGAGARWLITDQDTFVAGRLSPGWRSVRALQEGSERGTLWRWAP